LIFEAEYDRSTQYPGRAHWYLENLQNWSAAQQTRLNLGAGGPLKDTW